MFLRRYLRMQMRMPLCPKKTLGRCLEPQSLRASVPIKQISSNHNYAVKSANRKIRGLFAMEKPVTVGCSLHGYGTSFLLVILRGNYSCRFSRIDTH